MCKYVYKYQTSTHLSQAHSSGVFAFWRRIVAKLLQLALTGMGGASSSATTVAFLWRLNNAA
jgi:ABC-type uncharacterized transport system permease subunit